MPCLHKLLFLLIVSLTVIPVAAEPTITADLDSYEFAFPTTGTVAAADISDGVWWRPELDETSITQVMQNLDEWGIKNLYLDVFRSGETLFPSSVLPQQSTAKDRDWLQYIIAKGHEHNIRVHAWAQVLCWQEPDADADRHHPLLSLHPEWLEVSKDEMPFDGESAARFVSPGVSEVKTILLALTQEICRYPVDGLNLDTIQYNHRVDMGYNATVVAEYEKHHGIRPSDLERDTQEDSDWMKWVAYREDKLTSLVQLMGDQTRLAGVAADRRILFTVNVLPIYEETRGRNTAYQHWGQWVESKLVDATIPQCFNPDLPGLEKQLWQVRSVHMGAEIACIPGLLLDATTTNSHPTLKEQQRLLSNTDFRHNNIMDYQGLLLEKHSPLKDEAEPKRGFWDFLRPGRRDTPE